MNEINKITGRHYGLFNYYGAEDADRVIIAMGSVTEAAREAIDYLMANGGKVGLVSVHLYRPSAYDDDGVQVGVRQTRQHVVADLADEAGAQAASVGDAVCVQHELELFQVPHGVG